MDTPRTCPGCGTIEHHVEVERVPGFSILRCQNCSLEFSDPMWNPGGDWYDRAYILRHSAIDTRIRDYYRWTMALIPDQGRLLDIGCGEGVFVAYAKKKGFDAYGTDFSQEAIELGKMWYGLNTIYNSSLSELKHIECFVKFDVITFFEVLEHVENPELFLQEVKTLLKSGGRIALSVPLNGRWPVREFNDYPPHHLTRWTQNALQSFIESNGFEVVRMKEGAGLRSYATFIAYLARFLLYKIFGYQTGLSIENTRLGFRPFRSRHVKNLLSFLRPRQIRDALIWPFAIITYPFFFPFFKGYNLMLVARKTE